MTQHQQLQKKINGIIQPDAEKLLVQGCEIILEDIVYTIGINCNVSELRAFKNFEILGQKLNLEAVLMGFHKSKIQFQVTYLLSETVSVIINFHEQIIFKWHLTLPPDQQPIETQKALFEIFGV